MKPFCLLCILLVLFGESRSQPPRLERFNTFSYGVNEGLLQTTIGDMEVDANNYCWIAFPNGIQKFDGRKFYAVPVQPGLPDDKRVRFFRCRNGRLFVCHAQGISLYDAVRDDFAFVYKNAAATSGVALPAGEWQDRVSFYAAGSHTLVTLRTDNGSLLGTRSLPIPPTDPGSTLKFSANVLGGKAAAMVNGKLYRLDLVQARLLDSSVRIEGASPFFLHMKTESQVWFNTYTVNNALQVYDFVRREAAVHPVVGKDDRRISRCAVLPQGGRTFIAFNNKLYLTNGSLQALQAQAVNFQNAPVAGSVAIPRMVQDNFGNIYLQTVSGGIRKLLTKNYPIRYYGSEKGEENNTLGMLVDKAANRVLVGAKGLLVFDTLQRLVKHIRSLPDGSATFLPNNIVKTPNGDYLLFCVGQKNAWRLRGDLSSLQPVPIASDSSRPVVLDYFGTPLYQSATTAVVQTQGKLYRIRFGENKITQHHITSAYVLSGALWGNRIVLHAADELLFVDTASFVVRKRLPFKNTGDVRCCAVQNGNRLYAGTNNGIFCLDTTGRVLSHRTVAGGLPDNCVYAMAFDADGFLWCSSNKGLFRLSPDGGVLPLAKADGLQESEFNTSVVTTAPDGELFFGGVNGVSSFYPRSIQHQTDSVSLLITGLKVNNETVPPSTSQAGGAALQLDYDQNNLAFDFVAMGSANPDQYVYQYRMLGVDKDWLQNTPGQTVRYSLPPGDYTLQACAGRAFDKDAKPLRQLTVRIAPPFWKRWWFVALWVAALAGLVAFVVHQKAATRYQKRLAALERERQLQGERERISRDLHDSIGAYANAVLYHAERVESTPAGGERHSAVRELRFASRDIITSLRETVWALKKETYSAEDCLLRIRNFMQTLSRYYPQIRFVVDGEAPLNRELPHAKALNLVRTAQEIITNAVKHADASVIRLENDEAAQEWTLRFSDNGKGFDGTAAAGTDSNGLRNLRKRAEDAGFALRIQSAVGEGTVVTLTV